MTRALNRVIQSFLLGAGILLSISVSAQQSPVEWDRTFGGSMLDGHNPSSTILRAAYDPTDDAYLTGCISESGISGSKTEASRGREDFWIVKNDANGNKLWDRTYGGNSLEELNAIVVHSEGNYYFIGSSQSPVSGDKTQANTPGTFNHKDIWIVKTAPDGSIIWDRTFGGNDQESALQAIETRDGNLLVLGITESPVSGFISQPSRGNIDAWLLKIDTNGVEIWNHRYGGNNNDELFDLVELPNGDLILGGHTNSDVSGEVSQSSRGGTDYWVLKTDSLGTPLKDFRFGSSGGDISYQLLQTGSDRFLMGTYSGGPADGEKSAPSRGIMDFWIVTFDTSGQLIHDHVYGGTGVEQCMHAVQLCDGNVLLQGISTSGAGFERSEPSKGGGDYWTLKVDPQGNRIWDLSLGGSGTDFLVGGNETREGNYIWAGFSNSGISGDKTGPNEGDFDYWLVRVEVKAGFETSADTICSGEAIRFQDESTRITEAWEWDFGDPGSGALNVSADPNPSHVYALPGTYQVRQVVFEGCQPSDTLFRTVTVLPAVVAAAGPDTVICDAVPLVMGDAAQPMWNYQWSPANLVSDVQAAQPLYVSDSAGTVYLYASNGYCEDRDTVEVNVVYVDAGPDLNLCPGDVATIGGLSQAGVRYSWDPPLDLSDPSAPFTQASPAQTQQYTLTVEAGACRIQDDMLLTVLPQPVLTIGVQPQEVKVGNPVLFQNNSSGAIRWTWLFGDGGSSTLESPGHVYTKPGTYTVTLAGTNDAGCESATTAEVVVYAGGQLFVPNAFSPNADGLNDLFEVFGVKVEQFQIRIFDRYGRLIFQSTALNQSWDGTFKGEAVPEGNYVYRIESESVDGESLSTQGTISLIR